MPAAIREHSLVDEYLNFLAVERGASLNTLDAYSRDIHQFLDFATAGGVSSPLAVKPGNVTAFLGELRDQGLSSTSMNRKLAAIRGFYKYLLREARLEENPLARVQIARTWMRLPGTLSREEMETLLGQPADATPAGIRDRAILEASLCLGDTGNRAGNADPQPREPADGVSRHGGQGGQGADRARRPICPAVDGAIHRAAGPFS